MLLHELTPQGSRHVSECLRRGEAIVLGPEHQLPLVEIAVGDLEHVERMLAASELPRPALDGLLAELLHRALPLGRRLATQRWVWAWLGVAPLWPILTRRWPPGMADPQARVEEDGLEDAPAEPADPATVSEMRMLGRLYEHGLARVWWTAELTVDVTRPDPYADTRRLAATQYSMDRLLRSELSRNRTVLLGILDALGDAPPRRRVSHVVSALSQLDTTVALDALSRDEVASLAGELIAAGPGE